MYRKLVWLPVLAFLALAAAMATLPDGPWTTAGSFPVASYYAKLTNWLPANASGDLRLAITFFLTALLPMLAGLLLTWYAAFHPGKKATVLQSSTKYLAVLAVGAQLVVHIYYRASTIATAVQALKTQIPKPLATLLL
ncbi:MAG TPA: hypothetical protein VNT75_00305, partial [Symbiobacteriaceae bacterium]|nr:hypothetical protein [Symbiobacteriaceae bacterium]